MNNNRRYNQFLFLMTLSVYMGLVLAGGASPALAQAAMAKGFELKTELEAKDDLDKKPNDEKSLETVGRADTDITSSFGETAFFWLDDFAGSAATLNNHKFDLKKAVTKITQNYFESSRIDLDLTAPGYEPASLAVSSSAAISQKLAVHAEPVFENDQSILTTNLPRAGLDKLLAAK